MCVDVSVHSLFLSLCVCMCVCTFTLCVCVCTLTLCVCASSLVLSLFFCVCVLALSFSLCVYVCSLSFTLSVCAYTYMYMCNPCIDCETCTLSFWLHIILMLFFVQTCDVNLTEEVRSIRHSPPYIAITGRPGDDNARAVFCMLWAVYIDRI